MKKFSELSKEQQKYIQVKETIEQELNEKEQELNNLKNEIKELKKSGTPTKIPEIVRKKMI